MFLKLCVVFRTAFYPRALASTVHNRSTIPAGGAGAIRPKVQSKNIFIIQRIDYSWTEGKLSKLIVRADRGKQRCFRRQNP